MLARSGIVGVSASLSCPRSRHGLSPLGELVRTVLLWIPCWRLADSNLSCCCVKRSATAVVIYKTGASPVVSSHQSTQPIQLHNQDYSLFNNFLPFTNPPTKTIMRSFVYVALFLAAAAAASPVDAGQQSSSQGSQSQSSMNATPLGMSSSQSSSSYSTQQSSQVVQSFQPVLGLLGQMQGAISGGTMTQAVASNYVNQLVSQLQPALNGINACGCFGLPTVGPVINNVFSQMSQVMQSFQSSFGGAFGGIVSPFQQIAPSFQSFFQQSQQSSSSSSYTQSINPFLNIMQPVVPGF
ncbi:uncharacterized protein VP01_887g1 [Puccinia sorghi]|uniref:Uncharacterized protein n=1 Tax=Puccinia sorghi TaxID=27349 RepID=A0A0L6U892_9BASI|nr:uncharacterized protein VP01_887g1 [Puccinia sorghi]